MQTTDPTEIADENLADLSGQPRPVQVRERIRALLWAAASVAAAGVLAVALAERAGWPFLADPAERLLSRAMGRSVSFAGEGSSRFQLHLFGGIRLLSARMTVANAPWGGEVPLVDARKLDVNAAWRDVWAARGGQALRLQRMAAGSLALDLQRRKDGSANWRFGAEAAAPSEKVPPSPVKVDALAVDSGTFGLVDAANEISATGVFNSVTGPDDQLRAFVAKAGGRYRGFPLQLDARAGASLAAAAQGDKTGAVPVSILLQAGRVKVKFDGSITGIESARWDGVFEIAGPSLAAAGQPLGVTLPTTSDFTMGGHLQHEAGRTTLAVARGRIGQSELAGDFVYDSLATPRPRLSGELRGRALLLKDLGPSVGMTTQAESNGHVIPSRQLDIPSLSRMDADVTVHVLRLVLGHPKLQSVNPLAAHIRLKDGVLAIEDIDARLAQGRITGRVALDGRPQPAAWKVDLALRGLRLEEWITQPRSRAQPPYVSGRLAGRIQLEGRGRSSSELLASSNGRAWLVLNKGSISHFAVEAAGLDLAQAFGVALRGDDALPITCAAANLSVRHGEVRPEVFLVDTTDSTVWAEGRLSLADERIDLTARVNPKDFSPLSLRSPLRLTGTLAQPKVSIEKAPLLRRLVPAALLAMVNPLAALLPLLDAGDGDASVQGIEACREVVLRHGNAQDGGGKVRRQLATSTDRTSGGLLHN